MLPLPALCVGFVAFATCTPFSLALMTSAATRNINLGSSRPAADAFSTITTVAAGDGRRRWQQHSASAGPTMTSSPAEQGATEAAAGGIDAALHPSPSAAAVSRGGFLTALGSSAALAAAVVASAPEEAGANGMLDFPPARLNNRYFLMRSGQGGADKEGRVQSHPIDKLHMDNSLTEQGVEEAQRAAGVLASLGVSDAYIWADISSRAQDTAKILAQELGIRQERVVPEYSFLNPRGMGIFDGGEVASVVPTVGVQGGREQPYLAASPQHRRNPQRERRRCLRSRSTADEQAGDAVPGRKRDHRRRRLGLPFRPAVVRPRGGFGQAQQVLPPSRGRPPAAHLPGNRSRVREQEGGKGEHCGVHRRRRHGLGGGMRRRRVLW